MNILIDFSNIIRNNFDNGVSRVVRNIYRSLDQNSSLSSNEISGCQIVRYNLYFFDPSGIDNYSFKAIHRRFSNRFIRFLLRIFDQLSRKYQSLFIFRLKKNLFNIKKLDNFILILPDASWSFEFNFAFDEFKRRGGKVIFYIHDIIPLDPIFLGRSVIDIKFQKWIDWGILNADVLLCVSNDS